MSKHWPLWSSGQDIRHVFPAIHLQTGGNEVTVEKLEHGSWVSAETFPPPLVMNIHNESQKGITQNCAHMEDKDSILFHLHTLLQFFILMTVLSGVEIFRDGMKTFFSSFPPPGCLFFTVQNLALLSRHWYLTGGDEKRVHLNVGALRWNFQKFLTSCEHTIGKKISVVTAFGHSYGWLCT